MGDGEADAEAQRLPKMRGEAEEEDAVGLVNSMGGGGDGDAAAPAAPRSPSLKRIKVDCGPWKNLELPPGNSGCIDLRP
eukprot:3588571-Pyramimonas_sp.AAC.1